VIELTGPLTFLLIGNSLLTITFILNQNESAKDSTTQNSGSASNPFENLTWICFLFQLLFLLLKTKLTDF
jgi:hypothetical protein